MTGSKTTIRTTEEMKAARKKGESQSDWALLRHNAINGIEPEEDEDSPDASMLMRESRLKRTPSPHHDKRCLPSNPQDYS